MKKTVKLPKISILIPAKDEEENIGKLLIRLKEVIRKNGLIKPEDFEIIVVCDNCKDKTEQVAKSQKVKIIKRVGNPGKSKSLIEGFTKARGKIFVMMDADLSHLPEELPTLIKKLKSRKNIGLVVASRILGSSDDTTFIRDIGGRSLTYMTNLFFGTKLTDSINGYKIFRRHIFDNYRYDSSGYAIEIELVANTKRSKMEIAEIPSYEAKRAGGLVKSKVIKDGWIFFREILLEGLNYRMYQFLNTFKK